MNWLIYVSGYLIFFRAVTTVFPKSENNVEVVALNLICLSAWIWICIRLISGV